MTNTIDPISYNAEQIVTDDMIRAGRQASRSHGAGAMREIYLAMSRAAPADAERLALAKDDANDRMVRISKLIADMQEIQGKFGDTCVYIRRGGVSWGAVALNRQADDEKHGVFDLQAQHDRDMEARLGQVERLKKDRDEWRDKALSAGGWRGATCKELLQVPDSSAPHTDKEGSV